MCPTYKVSFRKRINLLAGANNFLAGIKFSLDQKAYGWKKGGRRADAALFGVQRAPERDEAITSARWQSR
jgi:hypothetical protein